MPARKKRIIVGISGGVDSAVAVLLLRDQGHDVAGLFMKNWEEDDDAEYCAAAEDYRSARAVCEVLEIPLHAINFAREYWDRVFAHFLAEYRAGRTPNPDVLCNREIKFKAFLAHARALGADSIATGHYARTVTDASGTHLLKGVDGDKDQSYFLHAIDQQALAAALFPLGDLTKREVRARARAAGLPNHARKDSTGICFIGERRFKDFLQRYLPAQPGEIRTTDGAVKGRHDGLMYYTIGQRQGLGIGGPGEAWYVAGKDLDHNILYVVQGEHDPALYAPALLAQDLSWIAGRPPALPLDCRAKTRYRQADQACTIERASAGQVIVRFAQAQRAITPGQSVVFYYGDECLGGGIIARALIGTDTTNLIEYAGNATPARPDRHHGH